MKRPTQSIRTAWLLLAVYLSMVVLSSLHVHPESLLIPDECEQCMHHLPHAGHLSASNGVSDDCLLCQFLSLTYVAVVLATVIFVQPRITLRRIASHSSFRLRTRGVAGLRAPPYRFV